MTEHKKNVVMLQHMLSVLMLRQSAWQLTDDEKQMTREGIKALQAAIETMNVQIYA